MNKLAEEITRYYFNSDKTFCERKKTLTNKQLEEIFLMLKKSKKLPNPPSTCLKCMGLFYSPEKLMSICSYCYNILGVNSGSGEICNILRFNKGLNILKKYFERNKNDLTEIE